LANWDGKTAVHLVENCVGGNWREGWGKQKTCCGWVVCAATLLLLAIVVLTVVVVVLALLLLAIGVAVILTLELLA